jgi:alpha/beta hydrolase fold
MSDLLPIIYVRGFAGATSGINAQTDDPFYGFNSGATHIRVNTDGAPYFFQFGGPLLRLISEFGYRFLPSGADQAYRGRDGNPIPQPISQLELLAAVQDGGLPKATVWVHRFYDRDADTWTARTTPFRIEDAASSLLEFVMLVRRKTGADQVYLVAHSMGGLICRSMLQKYCVEGVANPILLSPDNPDLRPPPDRGGAAAAAQSILPPIAGGGSSIVAKLFTYATPHNGISTDIAPGWFGWIRDHLDPVGSAIFGPDRMYAYLTPGTPPDAKAPPGWMPNVMTDAQFPLDRVFCLIGTDAQDYAAAFGMSEEIIGPDSDGLVQIANASVPDAHYAYVHRSHSGRYGIVNSEEGYQNLARFLFGDLKATLTLTGMSPPDLAPNPEVGWLAELRVSVRGLPVITDEQLMTHFNPITLTKPAQGLVTTFLFAPTPQRPTTRYAIHLRVHVQPASRRIPVLKGHLEQVADWDDILLIDVLQQDGELSAKYDWQSELKGATADTAVFHRIPGQKMPGVWSIELPDVARSILNPQAPADNSAGILLSVSDW